MMRFNKRERDIIRSIVAYRDTAESLADMFNKSHLLENQGWAIVPTEGQKYHLFYRYDQYDYEDEQKVRGLLAELLALLEKLYKERFLVAFPSSHNRPLVIGRENVEKRRLDVNVVNNGEEYILLSQLGFGWYDKNKESLYGWCDCTEMVRPYEKVLFSAYHVSQDIVNFVYNKFRTEEDIRFRKQQIATWVSIAVAFVIGLLSLKSH